MNDTWPEQKTRANAERRERESRVPRPQLNAQTLMDINLEEDVQINPSRLPARIETAARVSKAQSNRWVTVRENMANANIVTQFRKGEFGNIREPFYEMRSYRIPRMDRKVRYGIELRATGVQQDVKEQIREDLQETLSEFSTQLNQKVMDLIEQAILSGWVDDLVRRRFEQLSGSRRPLRKDNR